MINNEIYIHCFFQEVTEQSEEHLLRSGLGRVVCEFERLLNLKHSLGKSGLRIRDPDVQMGRTQPLSYLQGFRKRPRTRSTTFTWLIEQVSSLTYH